MKIMDLRTHQSLEIASDHSSSINPTPSERQLPLLTRWVPEKKCFQVASFLGSHEFQLIRFEDASDISGASSQQGQILASMPGKVLRLHIDKGATVQADQVLLVLEAMKMENEIRSTCAGVVADIQIQVGDTVETGQLLIKIES